MTKPTNPTNAYTVPSVSITTARTGASSKANALGMRAMQERAYAKRGEQYLLIKSPPASGKSRALMFIALDKLNNQGLRQAIVVVPKRSIGGSFADEPLSHFASAGRSIMCRHTTKVSNSAGSASRMNTHCQPFNPCKPSISSMAPDTTEAPAFEIGTARNNVEITRAR